MCQALTVSGAGDVAVRKTTEVPALKEIRAVYANYHCEHDYLPTLKCTS